MSLEKYFPKFITDRIIDLTSNSYEICGIIVRDKERKYKLIESENIAANPQTDFRISDQAQIRAYSEGNIVAVYHTHWSDDSMPYLSPNDISQSKVHNIPYLLYHPSGVWDYFDPKLIENPYPLSLKGDPKTLDYYLNWEWQWDRCDCWSLIRAYYKGMLGIELEDYSRSQLSKRDVFKQGFTSFFDHLPKIGFTKSFGNPSKNDLVLMTIEGQSPHHIGVMVDNKRMLHLYGNRKSSEIVAYLGEWENSTNCIWKYIS